jgi:hypothetical protein
MVTDGFEDAKKLALKYGDNSKLPRFLNVISRIEKL